MASGEQMGGDRSADIARRARTEDFHGACHSASLRADGRASAPVDRLSEAIHHQERNMDCFVALLFAMTMKCPYPRCFLKNPVARSQASSAALRSCTDCRCSLTKACSAS